MQDESIQPVRICYTSLSNSYYNLKDISSTFNANRSHQPIKLGFPSTKQVPYLPKILDIFLPLKFPSRVFSHFFSNGRWYSVAGTEDGTIEGEDSLTEEEVVEREWRFVCEAGTTDGACGCCVGAGEAVEGEHKALRECHA